MNLIISFSEKDQAFNVGLGEIQVLHDSQSSAVPSYWEAHLAEKIATIKALQDEGGKDCFSYVVMADMHYPSNLGKRSPLLAKKIMDACNIKYALILGDTRTRGCHGTKKEAETEWSNIEEMLAPLSGQILMTQGNHDAGYGYDDIDGDGVRDYYIYEFTPAEMFNRVYRKAGMTGDAVYDASGTAFYVDDAANKVRYILLNTQLNFDGNAGYSSYETVDGMAKYPSMRYFRYTQCQYDFLTTDALATVPGDDWGVVIGSHVPINQSGEMKEFPVMIGVLEAFENKTTYAGEYAGTANGGSAEGYTNLADPNTKGSSADSTLWLDGYRISSGAGIEVNAGYNVTNVIPCVKGDTVRIKGVDASAFQRICIQLTDGGFTSAAYLSTIIEGTAAAYEYTTEDDGATMVIKLNTHENTQGIRLSIKAATDVSNLIITVNEPIVEGGSTPGYDHVSVNCDFTNAKGSLVCYNGGHVHKDLASKNCYPNVPLTFPIITTRCDAKVENDADLNAERITGTITEQSFDVFTVNTKNRTIHRTKIGAGSDGTISY